MLNGNIISSENEAFIECHSFINNKSDSNSRSTTPKILEPEQSNYQIIQQLTEIQLSTEASVFCSSKLNAIDTFSFNLTEDSKYSCNQTNSIFDQMNDKTVNKIDEEKFATCNVSNKTVTVDVHKICTTQTGILNETFELVDEHEMPENIPLPDDVDTKEFIKCMPLENNCTTLSEEIELNQYVTKLSDMCNSKPLILDHQRPTNGLEEKPVSNHQIDNTLKDIKGRLRKTSKQEWDILKDENFGTINQDTSIDASAQEANNECTKVRDSLPQRVNSKIKVYTTEKMNAQFIAEDTCEHKFEQNCFTMNIDTVFNKPNVQLPKLESNGAMFLLEHGNEVFKTSGQGKHLVVGILFL